MPQLNAYLTFDGNCAEAMRHYQKILGGEVNMFTHGESPMADQCAPEARDRIMHACLMVDGQSLMGADAMTHCPYEGVKGVSMTLNYPTAAEGQRVFDALAEGGKVTMPMTETFWAEGFGTLVDRYGVSWMLNCGMKPMS